MSDWTGPMSPVNKNKPDDKEWAGPMNPSSRYEETGSYDKGDRRKTDKTASKKPPTPSNTVYDYVKKENVVPPKDDETIRKIDKRMTLTEFQEEIKDQENIAVQTKDVYKTTGQQAIDFDPTKEVTIEGKTYPGKDIVYTVEKFEPVYLYGHDTEEKGSTKTLTAEQYDIYLENLGKHYISESKNIDSSALRDVYKESKEWHPETVVVKSDTGYDIEFPYAGAEKYRTYKKRLEREGFPLLFATALTGSDPLGLTSAYYTATGDKQKAIDVKIKALHSAYVPDDAGAWERLKNFGSFALQMPTTQIGMAAAGGTAFGAASTYAAGYVTGRYGASSAAMYALKGSELAVGGVFATLAVKDIHQTFESEGVGEGLGKLSTFALAAGAGYSGFKTGQTTQYKNVGFMRRGFQRGFENRIVKDIQTGSISGEQGITLIKASQQEFFLRQKLGQVSVDQGKLSWEKVQEFINRPKMKEFTMKHTLRRKSELYGSLTEGRDTVHDVDVMYSNLAKGSREMSYASERLGYGSDTSYMDIKPQQTGIVGRAGTIKQEPFIYESGHKGMRWAESAMRHGESSLELAHSGRVKDIPRAVELYTKLFESAGSPDEVAGTLTEYTTTMKFLESDPYIMKPSESIFVYGKSITQHIAGIKNKAYETIIPKSIQKNIAETSFQKTMGYNLKQSLVKNVKQIASHPSLSPKFKTFIRLPAGVASSSYASASPIMSSILKTDSSYYDKNKSSSYKSLSNMGSYPKSLSKSSVKSSVSTSLSPSINPSPSIISPSKSPSKSIKTSPSVSTSIRKSPSFSTSPSTSKSLSVIPSVISQYYPYIKPSVYGKGKSKSKPVDIDKTYKFRKFDLKSPFETLKKKTKKKKKKKKGAGS